MVEPLDNLSGNGASEDVNDVSARSLGRAKDVIFKHRLGHVGLWTLVEQTNSGEGTNRLEPRQQENVRGCELDSFVRLCDQ